MDTITTDSGKVLKLVQKWVNTYDFEKHEEGCERVWVLVEVEG